jgi:AraC family transcriptional regulator
VMQIKAAMPTEPLCRPNTVSHFEIEHSIASNGIHADIRNFGWEHSCKATFKVNSFYLDYSLKPRSSRSRLLQSDRRHTPPPGEMVFLPEGSVFDAECSPCEQRLLCLTFNNENASRLLQDDVHALDMAPCFDVRATRVRELMVQLAQEVRAPGFGCDVFIESAALMLTVELCRHFQSRPATNMVQHGGIADWRLRRINDRIEADMGGPLSIAYLAADCGMSSRHLIRTFKESVGRTLIGFIADARLRRAERELAEEDALIKVVAYNCGFRSAAAFSASFRKSKGLTPKQYREKHFRYSS